MCPNLTLCNTEAPTCKYLPTLSGQAHILHICPQNQPNTETQLQMKSKGFPFSSIADTVTWQHGHTATLHWLCDFWHVSHECRRPIWLTGSWLYHHQQRPGFNPRQVQSIQEQRATRTCFPPNTLLQSCQYNSNMFHFPHAVRIPQMPYYLQNWHHH